MTKNPLYNAVAALTYVILVVSTLNLLGHFFGDQPDNNFLAPLFALSLLTLSVSVMGFIFFYQPLLLLLEGKQKEAVRLFLKTTSLFAGFTVLILLIMVLVS